MVNSKVARPGKTVHCRLSFVNLPPDVCLWQSTAGEINQYYQILSVQASAKNNAVFMRHISHLSAGVDNGMTLRVGGSKRGDTLLEVEVTPHPVFERQGADIHMWTTVGLADALLGGSIRCAALPLFSHVLHEGSETISTSIIGIIDFGSRGRFHQLWIHLIQYLLRCAWPKLSQIAILM